MIKQIIPKKRLSIDQPLNPNPTLYVLSSGIGELVTKNPLMKAKTIRITPTIKKKVLEKNGLCILLSSYYEKILIQILCQN